MLSHIKNTEDFKNKGVAAKGFTLIELLVVIVILGILAAVVVFAVGGIRERAQDSACKTEAKTLKTAAVAGQAETPQILTEAALATANLIESESTNYNMTIPATGQPTVTAVAGQKCV